MALVGSLVMNWGVGFLVRMWRVAVGGMASAGRSDERATGLLPEPAVAMPSRLVPLPAEREGDGGSALPPPNMVSMPICPPPIPAPVRAAVAPLAPSATIIVFETANSNRFHLPARIASSQALNAPKSRAKRRPRSASATKPLPRRPSASGKAPQRAKVVRKVTAPQVLRKVRPEAQVIPFLSHAQRRVQSRAA